MSPLPLPLPRRLCNPSGMRSSPSCGNCDAIGYVIAPAAAVAAAAAYLLCGVLGFSDTSVDVVEVEFKQARAWRLFPLQ